MQRESAILHFRLWCEWLYHVLPHYKRHDFRKKSIDHKNYVLILCISFRNIFHIRQIQQDSIINMHMFHIYLKYSLILSCFNDTLIFSTDFSTHTQISNFMKIRLVGAELFHVDGQTDTHDEANSSREHLQTSQHFITMQWTHPLKPYQRVVHGAESRRLRVVVTDCAALCRKQHSAVCPQGLW
jgi:hypothetical protein